MTPTIHQGDCLDVLRRMPDNSIDAVICDPPYGLSNTSPDKVADTIVRWASGDREFVPAGKGFMGASWDGFVPPPAVWDECYRVLKPGGHLLAFAGSRTHDLMGISIRMAGFDIRDSLAWIAGSGFPKSLDVSKAIDKEANRRDLFEPIRAHIREWRDRNDMTNQDLNEAVGSKTNGCGMARHWTSTEGGQHAIPSKEQWGNLKRVLGWPDCDLDDIYDSVKDGADRPVIGLQKNAMSGWKMDGTTKFVDRDITTASTPEAKRWEGWHTSLKPAVEPITLARKPLSEGTVAGNVTTWGTGALNIDATRIGTPDGKPAYSYPKGPGGNTFTVGAGPDGTRTEPAVGNPSGRWPANVILDPAAAALLDRQSGTLVSNGGKGPHTIKGTEARNDNRAAYGNYGPREDRVYGDSGGASRFFHVAEPDTPFMYAAKAPKKERPRYEDEDGKVIQHPTTKPLAIMKWLCRLTVPEGGTVLDPFAGSGTTIEAAMLEGFHAVGIEAEAEYIPLIHQRIARATPTTDADTLFDNPQEAA